MLARIEPCAFGPGTVPAISPVFDPSGPPTTRNAPDAASGAPHSGRTVFAQAGCLACHRLDNSGNNGPGGSLTDIGDRFSRIGITRALLHSAAPMPSYRALSERDRRSLVAYLKSLRRGRSG